MGSSFSLFASSSLTTWHFVDRVLLSQYRYLVSIGIASDLRSQRIDGSRLSFLLHKSAFLILRYLDVFASILPTTMKLNGLGFDSEIIPLLNANVLAIKLNSDRYRSRS